MDSPTKQWNFAGGVHTVRGRACARGGGYNHFLKKKFQNSIAFGSAPQREADSQPISPLAKPAVSQTETHSLDFLSVADAAPSSGKMFHLRTSSGQMVMQPASVFMVGGSNPGRANMAPPPPTAVGRLGVEPPT